MSDELLIDTFRGVTHPWLCDGLGHFTTRNYTAWFDDASYHLFQSVGGVDDEDLSWVDIRVTNEYRYEINAGELTLVRSGFTAIGSSSVSTYHEMHNLSTRKVAAICTSKCVRFDLTKRKSSAIADNIRQQINGRIFQQSPA